MKFNKIRRKFKRMTGEIKFAFWRIFPRATDDPALIHREPDRPAKLPPKLEGLILEKNVSSPAMRNTYCAVINIINKAKPEILKKDDKATLAKIATTVFERKVSDERIRGYLLQSPSLSELWFWISRARDRRLFRYKKRKW